MSTYRKEQQALRLQVLQGAQTAECWICGKTVDADFLRLAHIKQRSRCTEKERLMLANVMLACVLGCDHLFERGYLVVNTAGKLTAGRKPQTKAVTDAVSILVGRPLSPSPAGAKNFLAWHRKNAPN